MSVKSQAAAETLNFMSTLVHTPADLDSGYREGVIKSDHLAMVAMGDQYGGLITPGYPEFCLDSTPAMRADMSADNKRPLVEAEFALDREEYAAALVLRLCLTPWIKRPTTYESAWLFDIRTPLSRYTTMSGIIDAIVDNSDYGQEMGSLMPYTIDNLGPDATTVLQLGSPILGPVETNLRKITNNVISDLAFVRAPRQTT